MCPLPVAIVVVDDIIIIRIEIIIFNLFFIVFNLYLLLPLVSMILVILQRLWVLFLYWQLYCSLNLYVWSFRELFLWHVWLSWLWDWFGSFGLFGLFGFLWCRFPWYLFGLWWSHDFILPGMLFFDQLLFLLLFLIFNLLFLFHLNIYTPILQRVQELWYLSILFCHRLILILHVNIPHNYLVQLRQVLLYPIYSKLLISLLDLLCFCDRLLACFHLWGLSLFACWWVFFVCSFILVNIIVVVNAYVRNLLIVSIIILINRF